MKTILKRVGSKSATMPERVKSLYRRFDINHINARRSIGVAAGEGKRVAEVIAVSTSTVCTGHNPSCTPRCNVVAGARR
ncbi:hypothetical protein [Erwinia tasmaniensis]|uniref:hypothetical protein n=1 Tax=Erwinia tasmaniensis TaxID=338565 RepID=UPI0002D42C8F